MLAWAKASGRSQTERDVRLCVDLDAAIGTPGWFRGLATLTLLCTLTLFLSPNRLPFDSRPTRRAPSPMASIDRPIAPAFMLPDAETASTAPALPLRAFGNGPVRLSGLAGGSLYEALRAQGLPFSVIQAYLKALSAHLDFEEGLAPDARFDLVVAHQRAADGRGKFGPLLYAGLTQPGQRLRLLPWSLRDGPVWLDATEIDGRRAAFVSPVAATRISSGFGLRFHPLLGYSRLHRGTDFAAPYGAPVRAVTDGVVEQSGWAGGYGQLVRLRHAGALGTGYAHLSEIFVTPGAQVRQGEVIGRVGATGLATGPHLHFEVYRDGEAVDPEGVRFASPALLSAAERMAFKRRLASLTGLSPEPSGPPLGATGVAPE